MLHSNGIIILLLIAKLQIKKKPLNPCYQNHTHIYIYTKPTHHRMKKQPPPPRPQKQLLQPLRELHMPKELQPVRKPPHSPRKYKPQP